MNYKSNIRKAAVLLFGIILLLFIGFAKEKNRTQMLEETELSSADTTESTATEVSEFPEGMFIPDSANAELPELTHFVYGKDYFRKFNEYSDTELKYFENHNSLGELSIDCENRDVSLSCYIEVVEDENYYQPFRVTAYKQDNSNLYVGDIFSTADSNIIIGKCIISYTKDELILSVGYFDNVADEQEKILESGVYYYYYNMLPFEKESMEKMGNPVELPDYSGYSGIWHPIYPSGRGFVEKWRWLQRYTYMELEIGSDGSVSGCMSQYEDSSECSYTEFSGNMEGNECIIKYDDDGYGHNGLFTFTFYENGIGVYVDEGGEPNGHGFPTGYNYYVR